MVEEPPRSQHTHGTVGTVVVSIYHAAAVICRKSIHAYSYILAAAAGAERIDGARQGAFSFRRFI